MESSRRETSWARAAALGVAAGVAGTAAMTIAEKLEQRLTRRPNSYVPAHTLERLLHLPERRDEDRKALNHAMHWGTGAALGALRGVMARGGLRGLRASLQLHAPVRLTTDQTLENATRVGAPPWTWSRDEQIIDVLHKAIYSAATGAVADRLLPAAPEPAPRRLRWRAGAR